MYEKLIALRKAVGAVLSPDSTVKTGKYSYSFTAMPNFWKKLTREADKLNLFIHSFNDGHDIVVEVVDVDTGQTITSRKTLLPKDAFQQEGAQTSYFYRRMVFRLLGFVDQGDTEITDVVLRIDEKDLDVMLDRAIASKATSLQVIDHLVRHSYELTDAQLKKIRDTLDPKL